MALEIEEIVKILIAIVVLALLVGVAIFLFKGKGGEILSTIRNFVRFWG